MIIPSLALHRTSIMMELPTCLAFKLFLEYKSALGMAIGHELPTEEAMQFYPDCLTIRI
jgi:hypothetical protein